MDAVSGDALKIALAVLLVNLVLMALFMRALLAPLVLLAVNVLSVAATLGLTVWFFQDVLGYPDITYYVPFAGAVLLVSLSSDYNVLIVGKIWAAGENRPMRDAIASAAPAGIAGDPCGRAVTGCQLRLGCADPDPVVPRACCRDVGGHPGGDLSRPFAAGARLARAAGPARQMAGRPAAGFAGARLRAWTR